MPKTALRPESVPLPWARLDEPQKKAFTELVELIGAAVDEIDQASHGVTGRAVPVSSSGTSYAWIRKQRTARTVLLSGARGTGKTTVFLSALAAQLGMVTDRTIPAEVDIRLRQLASRVIWLEPIDLDPPPPGMVAAFEVLIRIQEAVSELVAGPTPRDGRTDQFSFLSEPGGAAAEAIKELGLLQDAVRLGWGAKDDSESARARVSFAERFNRVLDDLSSTIFANPANGVSNPLFVLVVDDIDLTPNLCVEFLQFLRVLWGERFLCIALGDYNRIRECFEKIYTDTFAIKSSGAADLSRGSTIAVEALRKLIPGSQRVALAPMGPDEVIDHRPQSMNERAPDIAALLARVPVRPHESVDTSPARYGHACDHVLDLVQARADGAATGFVYSGRDALSMPPRDATNLWFALEAAGGERRLVLLRALVERTRDLLRGSGAFDNAEVEIIGAELDPAKTQWDIPRLPIHVDRAFTNPLEVGVVANEVMLRVYACPAQSSWDIRSRALDRRLSRHVAAHLVLLHDLLALGPEYHDAFSSYLVQGQRICFALAATRWTGTRSIPGDIDPDDSSFVAWPWIPFIGFWEVELFLHHWNSVVQATRIEVSGSDVGPTQKRAGETLAFTWLSLGTAIARRELPVLPRSIHPNQDDMDRLFGRISECADLALSAAGAPVRIQLWLNQLVVALEREALGHLIDIPHMGSIAQFAHENPHLRDERTFRVGRLLENADLRPVATSLEASYWDRAVSSDGD